MIIQITGNVTYPITLDPTVWIFDDRKILFEDNFTFNTITYDGDDDLTKASERFEREYFIKPPVNQSIKRFNRREVLKHSYVMPVADFIKTAEIKTDAKQIRLKTNEDDVLISIDQLESSLFLFAKNGKPLKEDGPVHLYFGDGSNQDEPIKNVKKIIVE